MKLRPSFAAAAAIAVSVLIPLTPGARAAVQHEQDSALCLSCHSSITPGIIGDWQRSKHSQSGVGCLACHRGEGKERKDVQEHYGERIVVLVTPKDCGECHPEESRQFSESHHARAAQFIGSLDSVLGEMVGGPQAVDVGCRQCHGSTISVLPDGKLDPTTWPNSGMGRLNPDGTAGSCSACHARHAFSVAQARQPEECGRCHMGPDHPQFEIYNESKHGILYRANREHMNLDRPGGDWRPARDYAYPTCSTCHMGPTATQPVTHDVGTRISWTLRPPISTKLENAEARRASMTEVCGNCHSAGFVGNFYQQYDSLAVVLRFQLIRHRQAGSA